MTAFNDEKVSTVEQVEFLRSVYERLSRQSIPQVRRIEALPDDPNEAVPVLRDAINALVEARNIVGAPLIRPPDDDGGVQLAIEQLQAREGGPGAVRQPVPPRSPLDLVLPASMIEKFWARLTDESSGSYTWEEVTVNSASGALTWSKPNGARTGTKSTATEAREINLEANIATNSIVEMWACHRQNGVVAHVFPFKRRRIIPFAGACMINEAVVGEQNANTNVAANSRGGPGGGAPDGSDEQWILCKFEVPVTLTNVAGDDRVRMCVLHSGTWNLDLTASITLEQHTVALHRMLWITSDFDYEGPGCAAWDDQPSYSTYPGAPIYPQLIRDRHTTYNSIAGLAAVAVKDDAWWGATWRHMFGQLEGADVALDTTVSGVVVKPEAWYGRDGPSGGDSDILVSASSSITVEHQYSALHIAPTGPA